MPCLLAKSIWLPLVNSTSIKPFTLAAIMNTLVLFTILLISVMSFGQQPTPPEVREIDLLVNRIKRAAPLKMVTETVSIPGKPTSKYEYTLTKKGISNITRRFKTGRDSVVQDAVQPT